MTVKPWSQKEKEPEGAEVAAAVSPGVVQLWL